MPFSGSESVPSVTMTASARSRGIPRPFPTSQLEHIEEPPAGRLPVSQRQFKKHKNLPHPRRESYPSLTDSLRSIPRSYDLAIETTLPREPTSLPSTQPTLKHRARRIGSGGSPPPTPPPVHSRHSSSSRSVLPSSPTYVQTPAQSDENVQPKQPTTPTNQKSPPTPDTTPPQAMEGRPKVIRPTINDRVPSKATTDSRTESFKTALESPYFSDEDDAKSTLRPVLPSTRTSDTTVRLVNGEEKRKPQQVGLGLGLESSPEDDLTPKAKREFTSFDGEYGSASEVEQEWDNNLQRNVTVRKRRPRVQPNESKDEVIEDVNVTPTNATKAARVMSLQERRPNPEAKRPPARSTSESSTSIDVRRSSGMSSKSTVSTVVEAILVGTPPQRQKTLRHVKKQSTLRDSGKDLTLPRSALTSLTLDEMGKRRRPTGRFGEPRQDSVASTGTFNSISSGRARRDVWKNGGIPVVVIPGRKSSVKSSKEPSLRSTSSHRSKRSQSVGSVPLSQTSQGKDLTPYFERPSRRSRAMSESDGSRSGDQRTMDYPPTIPMRSSSLSAPTSRNTSRAGSLTTESLKAKHAVQVHQAQAQKPPEAQKPPKVQQPKVSQRRVSQQPRQGSRVPEVTIQRPPSPESNKSAVEDHNERRHSVDHDGDPFFGQRLFVQNTPFSQASVDTNATSAAEVSEAMAVNIFPHQNRSLRVVNHSGRPSESSSGAQNEGETDPEFEHDPEYKPARQVNNPTNNNGDLPVTPPQPLFSMDDVDSPLRNPRAPPEPPAIKFIPATPSGLTPAQEKDKQLGNFYEDEPPKPVRGLSLLRRALSRRRNSEYGPSSSRDPGFLTRTFSLSRNVRKENGEVVRVPFERSKAPVGHAFDDQPAEEGKLHPFWRPAYSDYSANEDEDWVHDVPEQETYRYPPVDNRPPPPKRSLSARMKRTFAILPIHDDYEEYYAATGQDGPERRTIRRTASGNLRVMKHRSSLDSLRQSQSHDGRPYTAPDQGRRRPFWKSRPLVETENGDEISRKGRFFPGLGSRIEQYGLHTLPRRLSERRREKRNQELRRTISGPREVRDGVGDIIRRYSYREGYENQRY